MRALFAAILLVSVPYAMAQTRPRVPAPSTLAGIYQTIPDDVTLPGGLKNAGGPNEIALQPAAVQQMKAADLTEDAAKLCLPVGVFRMMARDSVKIELVPAPGMIVMLFEDISHGHARTIHLNRPHPEKREPSWLGDSTGRWESDTLVVDTIGFNDRTWLNAAGAPHSDALRTIERIRPLIGGDMLEYKVTVEDPNALAMPYTYVRYYRKLQTDKMMEDFCEAEL